MLTWPSRTILGVRRTGPARMWQTAQTFDVSTMKVVAVMALERFDTNGDVKTRISRDAQSNAL
jgi:hypothetical protein